MIHKTQLKRKEDAEARVAIAKVEQEEEVAVAEEVIDK
jgi:hypothetical protein